jgi:hypothetical protein
MISNIAGDDRWFGWSRWIVLAVLALATVASTCALVVSAVKEATWAAAGSAAALVGTLAVAGWMNPLQTIERDIIIRRWSDVLLTGWAADIAGPGSPRSATRHASDEFVVLCSAYAAMANKTVDAVSAIVNAKAASGDEPSSTAADVSIDAVPSQCNAQGEKLASALHINAAGGSGKYTFAIEDPPTGLTITSASGDITGTVDASTETKDWVVKVTATEVLPASAAGTAKSAETKFVWTITPKA